MAELKGNSGPARIQFGPGQLRAFARTAPAVQPPERPVELAAPGPLATALLAPGRLATEPLGPADAYYRDPLRQMAELYERFGRLE